MSAGKQSDKYMTMIVVSMLCAGSFVLLAAYYKTMVTSDLWFGVETMELTPAVVAQYNLRSADGVLISRVFIGSPADKAGVKPGDVLTRWNGVTVMSQDQLQTLLNESKAGIAIKIRVIRQGVETPLHLVLEVHPYS